MNFSVLAVDYSGLGAHLHLFSKYRMTLRSMHLHAHEHCNLRQVFWHGFQSVYLSTCKRVLPSHTVGMLRCILTLSFNSSNKM